METRWGTLRWYCIPLASNNNDDITKSKLKPRGKELIRRQTPEEMSKLLEKRLANYGGR